MAGNKYVKGRDGKFKGSIGSGKTNVPTVKPKPACSCSPANPEPAGASIPDNRWERVRFTQATRDPQLLKQLSEDSDAGVREAVADNPHTGVDVLSTLAGDECWLVRATVASSKATDPSTLTAWVLAGRDEEEDAVRRTAAENPNLPRSVHRSIVEGDDDEVKKGLLGNETVPEEVVATLAYDGNPDVVWFALRHRNCPSHVLDDYVDESDVDSSFIISGHPNASSWALERLCRSDDMETLAGVVENPNSTPETVKEAEGRLGLAQAFSEMETNGTLDSVRELLASARARELLASDDGE